MIRLHPNVKHLTRLTLKGKKSLTRSNLKGVRITEVPSHLPVPGPGPTSYSAEATDGKVYLRVIGDAGPASKMPRPAVSEVLDAINQDAIGKREPPVAYTVPAPVLAAASTKAKHVEVECDDENKISLIVDDVCHEAKTDATDHRWPNTTEGGGGIFPNHAKHVAHFDPRLLSDLLGVIADMGCKSVAISIADSGVVARIDGVVHHRDQYKHGYAQSKQRLTGLIATRRTGDEDDA